MSDPSDLDSILDSALDELDSDATANAQQATASGSNDKAAAASSSSSSKSTSNTSSTSNTASLPDPTSAAAPDDAAAVAEFQSFLKELTSSQTGNDLLKGLGDEKQMNEMFQALQAMSGTAAPSAASSSSAAPSTSSTSSTAAAAPSSSLTSTASATSSTPSGYNASIEEAIKMIGAGAKDLKSGGAGGLDGLPNMDDSEMQQMFMKLMQEMEGGGSGGAGGADDGADGSMDAMIEKLMGSMLSKDVLYQPMKDIEQKYPQWLSDNKSKLSAEEYDKYEKQYEVLKRICIAFETKPDDMNTIMNLMTEMQQYGQPPTELVPLSEQGEGGLFNTNAALSSTTAGALSGADPDLSDADMKKMMDETCKTQ